MSQQNDTESKIIVAAATATNAFGNLLSDIQNAYYEWLEALPGLSGVMIGGTTGQGTMMTIEQRMQLIREARATLSCPITFNITARAIGDVLKLVEAANDQLGSGDTVMMMVDQYPGLSDEPLSDWIKLIMERVNGKLKRGLYILPQHCNQFVPSSDVVTDLVSTGHLNVIKDSQPDRAGVHSIWLAAKEAGAEFHSGCDILSASLAGAGLIDRVTGMSQVLWSVFCDTTSNDEATRSGAIKKIRTLVEFPKRFGVTELTVVHALLGEHVDGFPDPMLPLNPIGDRGSEMRDALAALRS